MVYELLAYGTDSRYRDDIRWREYTTSKKRAEMFAKIPRIQFSDSGHGVVSQSREHKGRRHSNNYMLREYVSEQMIILQDAAKANKLVKPKRPRIVCLCGSTRFGEAFRKAQLEETLAGKIVLTIGCNMKSDTEIFGNLPEDELQRIKTRLDELHLRKIDMADEVLILNVGDYIGESTKRELAYAEKHKKHIRYLEAHT